MIMRTDQFLYGMSIFKLNRHAFRFFIKICECQLTQPSVTIISLLLLERKKWQKEKEIMFICNIYWQVQSIHLFHGAKRGTNFLDELVLFFMHSQSSSLRSFYSVRFSVHHINRADFDINVDIPSILMLKISNEIKTRFRHSTYIITNKYSKLFYNVLNDLKQLEDTGYDFISAYIILLSVSVFPQSILQFGKFSTVLFSKTSRVSKYEKFKPYFTGIRLQHCKDLADNGSVESLLRFLHS